MPNLVVIVVRQPFLVKFKANVVGFHDIWHGVAAEVAKSDDAQLKEKFESKACFAIKIDSGDYLEETDTVELKSTAPVVRLEFEDGDDWYDPYHQDSSDEEDDGAGTEKPGRAHDSIGGVRDDNKDHKDEDQDDDEDDLDDDNISEEEDDEEEETTNQTIPLAAPKDFKGWTEPKWSPILRGEIKGGRLYMKSNQDFLKEESAMHILGVLGWKPFCGAYVSFAKFLINKKKYQVMIDKRARKPWTTFATGLSNYIRSQRVARKKRVELQKASKSRKASAKETVSQTKRIQLENLRAGTVNSNQLEITLQNTLSMRKQLSYESYNDMLTAEPYLKDPIAFQIDAKLRLNEICPEVEREEATEIMLKRLHSLYGEGPYQSTNEIKKLRYLNKVHETVRLHKYNKSKFQPFEPIQIVAGQRADAESDRAREFGIRVFHNARGQIRSLSVCGNKETLLYIKEKSKASEAVSTFLGAHLVFASEPTHELEYMYHFLRRTILKIEIPTSNRSAKKSLHDFLNTQYRFQ